MATMGHEAPLVTIVTPSYNQGRFIRATIESVLSQDYPSVEYIIMDGKSTDETAAVVAPYLDRLTFLSERDRGQSHAINKGFAMARGKIVAWLNSDDVFLPGAIAHAVAAFQANPHIGVVYGEGYQIHEDGSVKCRFPHTQHFDLRKLVFLSDYILQQTVFFSKAALDAVGPIREDLHYIMDWDILIRLAKRFEFHYVPEYLGSLREYGTAKTFAGGAKRALEIRDMLREHTHMLYPPGYIVYGLDTYERLWTSAIDGWRHPFRRVGRLLRRVVSKVCYSILGRVMRANQAWHSDGWVSHKAAVMLPEGSGDIILVGMLPGVPELHKQTLTISHRGRVWARQHIEPGDFAICVTPPANVTATPILDVHASQYFVPAAISNSPDVRELSFILRSVRWTQPRTSASVLQGTNKAN